MLTYSAELELKSPLDPAFYLLKDPKEPFCLFACQNEGLAGFFCFVMLYLSKIMCTHSNFIYDSS